MENTILKQLQENAHPFEALAFNKVDTSQFVSSIEGALQKARQEFNDLKENPEEPSFANTMEALEFLGQDLGQLTSLFFNLLHACTEEVLDQAAPEISQKLAAFHNDLQLDPALFQKVKTLHDKKDSLDLTDEQKLVLEESYRGFVRGGALLDQDQQQKLRDFDNQMAELGPAYGENLRKATNSYSLNITNRDWIESLPLSAQQSAKAEAEKRNEEGWTFTLHAPSLVPFMKYMPDRNMRKTLWMAYNQKAYKGELSNLENCKNIARLRGERAQLLGYKSHAHFVLEERMAKTPQEALRFLEQLKTPAIEAAHKEVKDLQNFMSSELGVTEELMPWDFSFFSNIYKKHLFDYEDEDLRPYFPLDSVLKGLFEIVHKLYGLNFKKASIPGYHKDVQCLEVQKSGEHLGLLYLDFFPRDNKRAGAWMTTYRDQGFNGSKMQTPHVSLVCNFTKPSTDLPSLLTFNEVQTLFHEFGHGLHGLLSNCYYPSQAGTNVKWDFVELPSQILENWAFEKEALHLFAKHYQTGEVIPNTLIEKIQMSAQFQQGYATLRQLSFATLDFQWHSWMADKQSVDSLNPEKLEKEAMAPFRLFPDVEGTNFSVGFSHIFAGGYSAGYYSYKWAEVLDADAFELFKEKGIFNSEVAQRFENFVLSRGGTADPMDLYIQFRGRPPEVSALLKRSGLLEKS